MKRILSFMLVGVLMFSLAGCFNVVDEPDPDPDPDPSEVDCDLYPTHVDCLVDEPDPIAPGLINVLDELPDEQITVTFWHVYGQGKNALLLEYIEEFEAMYPNITIEDLSQSSYDDLRNKTGLAISSGIAPTMVVGYPDHVAGYLNSQAVIPLDDFIYDETWGVLEADGVTVGLGDFIDSYVDENRQYQGGYMYSIPYSKSTEMMVFNKTLFEANGITVPTDRAISFEELETYAETMVGSGANQCEYLINYDSSANLFINNVRMWDGGYTNIAGEILVENANTISMLNTMKGYFENKTVALPIAWNQQYGSTNFLAGDACMTVGSTAGISYNVPTDGSFEIGVAPIPQWDEDHKAATQQGPNIAILKNSSDAERLAAWLFTKYITDTEQTAKWSMDTGYLPVRYSAFESDYYQFFLGINDIDSTTIDAMIENYVNNEVVDPSIEDMVAYFEAEKDDLHTYYEALLGSAQTDAQVLKQEYLNMKDKKYVSMTAQAAYLQVDYYAFDPAFATQQTTSSDARVQAEIVMNAIFVGNYTVAEAIEDMMYQLNAK
jgi:multiple sugar transport system substrate-binding protein